ncbi:hypothetical protein PENTCL1PPCAC_7446, partial [Pristionchus entomophagus]
AEVEATLRHLLVLCCNGGAPFVDFHEDIKHFGTRAVDPTDWSAEDIAGSSLLPNSSLLSSLPSPFSSLLSSGTVVLDSCDLFNLTFASTADQTIFERYGAAIACRCPLSHRGIACESSNLFLSPQALESPLTPTAEAGFPPSMLIILCVIALSCFFFAFMMFRGCFCDCFGPFKWPGRRDEYDKEIDPEDLQRSLAKVRAYEERQRNNGSALNEVHRPLVVPSVSSGCAAPYDQLPIHSSHAPIHHPPPSSIPPPRPRASSPPPA